MEWPVVVSSSVSKPRASAGLRQSRVRSLPEVRPARAWIPAGQVQRLPTRVVGSLQLQTPRLLTTARRLNSRCHSTCDEHQRSMTTCVVPSWKACLSLYTTGPRSLTQRRSLDNGVLAGGARLPGDVRSGLDRITRRSPRRKTLPEIVNFLEPPRNRLAHGKAGA